MELIGTVDAFKKILINPRSPLIWLHYIPISEGVGLNKPDTVGGQTPASMSWETGDWKHLKTWNI